jgi:DNA-binding CsgD family transcriptional regulator
MVANQVAHMLTRLDLRNRAQLAAWYVLQGGPRATTTS